MNFVWETEEGKAESTVLLFFYSLAVLESSVDEGWLDGAESLI